jgi:hypothetical protein
MLHILGTAGGKIQPNKSCPRNVGKGRGTMTSLIRERMALDRALRAGRGWIIVGALGLAVSVVGGYSLEIGYPAVAYALLGVYSVWHGRRILLRARRLETTFNAQHGEKAGRQEPVR